MKSSPKDYTPMDLKGWLLATSGKIFSCTFVKKNGDHRRIVGRIKKPSDPAGPRIAPTTPAIAVWEFAIEQWRTVRTDRILRLKSGQLDLSVS